ncbi:hypothetical protein FGB62_347g02 [Gracilaria domingensis]|nr:hypothetical protein FGB62_347g02 [Gracilaria domingensis]
MAVRSSGGAFRTLFGSWAVAVDDEADAPRLMCADGPEQLEEEEEDLDWRCVRPEEEGREEGREEGDDEVEDLGERFLTPFSTCDGISVGLDGSGGLFRLPEDEDMTKKV